MDDRKPLTEKQELFCQRYLIDFNATQAAKDAGYSEDTAYSIGWENLRKPEIQQRIAEIRQTTGRNFNITRERLAQELAKIAFADVRLIFNEDGSLKSPENWPDDIAAVIAGVDTDEIWEGRGEDRQKVGETKKLKMWEKTKAIEALAKLMGYNEPDKLAVRGLTITVTDTDE